MTPPKPPPPRSEPRPRAGRKQNDSGQDFPPRLGSIHATSEAELNYGHFLFDNMKTMRIVLAILAFTVFLNGCASAPQLRSASLANAASAAQKRNDWASAAQLWEQAIQMENGIWRPEFSRSPKIIAIYYYELGRSLGVLGQHEDAEKHLLQALRLDEKFNGPKGMDLVELARLNHAYGNHTRAAYFFDQILPRMDEIAEADPAGHIALLHEAASVYQAIGQNGRAAELNTKAQKFSARHPNARFADDYSWTPYKNATR